MRARTLTLAATGVLVLIVGLWVFRPPASRANGDKDKEKGGHAHVPAPLEHGDTHIPLSIWTGQATIARGKETYPIRCAVRRAEQGDRNAPACIALTLNTPDSR